MVRERGPEWTEAGLRGIVPTGKRETFSDPDKTGLVLLMTPAGAKTFYLPYRVGGGRTGKARMLKIGRFPEDGGLKWARGQAKIERGKIQNGADPQGERQKARKTPKGKLVNDLCDRFIKVYLDGKQVEVATAKGYRRHIDKIIRPAIGAMECEAVEPHHITAMLEALPPGEANHVRSTVNRLFTRAPLWGMRKAASPVKGQEKRRVNGRKGYRLTESELRKVGKAIQGEPWEFRALVLVLALTGMRPIEFQGSSFSEKPQRPWKDVDLKAGTIHLPAEAHKTGKRSGEDRTVYLCREAVAVLKGLPEGEIVLGGWHNGTKAWKEFREAHGLGHVQLYDLRHTFISNAEMMIPGKIVSVLVGHAKKDMDDVYTHAFQKELKAGAQKVGGHLAKLLGL